MQRARKRLLIGIVLACVSLTMALLLTVVLAPRLLANRDLVKSYIVEKTAQATGGQLDYDHIEIDFFPLPHLAVQNVDLALPETFHLRAQELSVYPRILAMLGGRLSIHRLRLSAPDIRVQRPQNAAPPPAEATDSKAGVLPAIGAPIRSVFQTLAVIDPGTQVEIDQGRVTIDFKNDPDIQIHTINATFENNDRELAFDLSCASDLVKQITVQATADVTRSKANGKISLTDINPQLILTRHPLPAGIHVDGTRASAAIDFTVDNAEKIKASLNVQVPALSIRRSNRQLNISAGALSGKIVYEKNRLSLDLDQIAARQPALDLSATAVLQQDQATGNADLKLSAAAKQLNIAAVSGATLAIAGDQASIRTAFDFARAGMLNTPDYAATIKHDQGGWHLSQMKATARLSQGLVNISAINAAVEDVAGDIIFKNNHVDFLNLAGRFEGAAFNRMKVAMDWTNQTTWSLTAPSVDVEAAPFFTWITSFEALAGIRAHLSVASGRATVSRLDISGPLTEPGEWEMDILASPQDLILNTPQVPFDIKLSGGEIIYRPGNDQSSNIGLEFLDASFVASHQSSVADEKRSVNLVLDGSMGAETLAWLNERAHFPEDIEITAPVSLTGVNLTVKPDASLSLAGGIKTASGVEATVNLTNTSEKLQINALQFSDGFSNVRLSGSKQNDIIDLTFTGNVEKQTVDRFLRTNPFLSGRIEGDFRARIHAENPLASTVVGKLTGNGLHLPEHLTRIPITVNRFSVVGGGNRFEILPSEVAVDDILLQVDGTLVPGERALFFEANVNSDRLDVGLIQSLKADENKGALPEKEEKQAPTIVPSGTIHLKSQSLTYGDFTWSPVDADIRIESGSTYITINQAQLCGISTTGDLDITDQGIGLSISPLATNVSLQKTYDCLWDKYIRADARYDLVGNIDLLPGQKDPIQALSGRVTFSSKDGRIYHSSTLLKIFSVLNITELFTGGQSDLNRQGYGYSTAWIKARLGAGKLYLDEVLLDGNALKITGQGSIDLKAATADITVLAAPLKTVDRLVNKIPIFRYITGGSLITVPLRLHGKIRDLSVVPLPPSAVGRGLLNFMERTLKAPFKLVEGAKGSVTGKTEREN